VSHTPARIALPGAGASGGDRARRPTRSSCAPWVASWSE